MDFSTHTVSRTSVPEWMGNKPCKFKGGRNHNHPSNELNQALFGSKSDAETKGKKQYIKYETIGTDQTTKPHLRTYKSHYDPNRIFEVQNLQKLIKIKADESGFIGSQFRNKVGYSKMKELQTGNKKTGIYRNFYNSQSKSNKAFPSLYH